MTSLVYNADIKDKLEAQAQVLVSAKQFHSVQWHMTQHNEVKSSGAIGFESAHPEHQPLYRLYSMTKPVVSFVAMQLLDEGKLKLEDKVSQYLPDFANLQVLGENDQPMAMQTQITIEHLLTHTAGLSYDFLPECSVASQYRKLQISARADRSLSEVVALLGTMPLASQPGQQWRYSVATDVLAHVLEVITQQDLPGLLKARVFDVLNMQDTAFSVPDSKLNRLLPMYGARDLGDVIVESDEPNTLNLLNVDASYPTQPSQGFYRGGHGLYSTMQDYIQFMGALKTGATSTGQQLLSEQTLNLMWSNRISSALMPLKLGFNVLGGYGWSLMGRLMIDPAQCEFKTAMGEGGWSGAASTYFWIDKANDISGIVMTQYLGSTVYLGPLMHHAAYSNFKQS